MVCLCMCLSVCCFQVCALQKCYVDSAGLGTVTPSPLKTFDYYVSVVSSCMGNVIISITRCYSTEGDTVSEPILL